jgi:hypothetical protein
MESPACVCACDAVLACARLRVAHMQAGEIERALAISKMQGAGGRQGSAMLAWLRGGVRGKAAAPTIQTLTAAPPSGGALAGLAPAGQPSAWPRPAK